MDPMEGSTTALCCCSPMSILVGAFFFPPFPEAGFGSLQLFLQCFQALSDQGFPRYFCKTIDWAYCKTCTLVLSMYGTCEKPKVWKGANMAESAASLAAVFAASVSPEMSSSKYMLGRRYPYSAIGRRMCWPCERKTSHLIHQQPTVITARKS
jgi:hypothetical protein